MSKSDLGRVWNKIMKVPKFTTANYDVKRCLLAKVYIVDQLRKNHLRINKKPKTPDAKQVGMLVYFVMNKMPGKDAQAGLNELAKIPTLTKDDFSTKMHLWECTKLHKVKNGTIDQISQR